MVDLSLNHFVAGQIVLHQPSSAIIITTAIKAISISIWSDADLLLAAENSVSIFAYDQQSKQYFMSVIWQSYDMNSASTVQSVINLRVVFTHYWASAARSGIRNEW